jgi:arsenate reductase
MKKIYHLSSCNTCQRIIRELQDGAGFELQDIKASHIDGETLDWLAEQAGSYEALFNKRAMKYRAQGLNQRSISEPEFRELILGEYTFLKRPVIIIGEEAFIGNAKKTVAAAKERLGIA